MAISREELSNMTVSGFRGSEIGNQWVVSEYCWPSYVRKASKYGGDAVATFRFEASDWDVYEWMNSVGKVFSEWYAGERVFYGIVNTVRWSRGQDALVRSLDTVANSITVQYTDSNGAEQVSNKYQDTESQAKYGVRQLVVAATEEMSSSTADTYAQTQLALMKEPKTHLVGVNGAGSTVTRAQQLEITVIGAAQTLNNIKYSRTGQTSDSDIGVLINDMLIDTFAAAAIGTAGTAADFVIPGFISSAGSSALGNAEDRPMLDRIISLAQIDGFAVGCFGSNEMSYFEVPADLVYVRDEKDGAYGVYLNGEYVPPATVKPYGELRVGDVSPAHTVLPDDAKENPTIGTITGIEFSINGVNFSTDTPLFDRRKERIAAIRNQAEWASGRARPQLIGPPTSFVGPGLIGPPSIGPGAIGPPESWS